MNSNDDTTADDSISFDMTPSRAILTMRDLVVLDAEVGPGDLSSLLAILGRSDVEDIKLDVTLFEKDEDGSAELIMGDTEGDVGTFLTVQFGTPAQYAGIGFKLIIGQERLASIWAEGKEAILAHEQSEGAGDPAVTLIRQVLQFASGEGGAPVVAFENWLAASGRKGSVGIPALALAA